MIKIRIDINIKSMFYNLNKKNKRMDYLFDLI